MRRPKTKTYDTAELQTAVRAVQRAKTLAKVASIFGIPKTTVYDNAKGKRRDNFQ